MRRVDGYTIARYLERESCNYDPLALAERAAHGHATPRKSCKAAAALKQALPNRLQQKIALKKKYSCIYAK